MLPGADAAVRGIGKAWRWKSMVTDSWDNSRTAAVARPGAPSRSRPPEASRRARGRRTGADRRDMGRSPSHRWANLPPMRYHSGQVLGYVRRADNIPARAAKPVAAVTRFRDPPPRHARGCPPAEVRRADVDLCRARPARLSSSRL